MPKPDDILEAWRTNNRISLFLIAQISLPGMRCTLSKRGDARYAIWGVWDKA